MKNDELRVTRMLKTAQCMHKSDVFHVSCLYVLFAQETLQSFSFLVFVAVCILGTIYLYVVLPETKNKTFMDISQSFAKINKMPIPSPGQEMELVLSINSDTNGKAQDATKMQTSL